MVLCGVSAGMNCWFEASVTDSFDRARLAPLRDGAWPAARSACPHYDGEEQRRPTFRRLVAGGELPDGWAADDGAALVFAGRELARWWPRARTPAGTASSVLRTEDARARAAGALPRRVEPDGPVRGPTLY